MCACAASYADSRQLRKSETESQHRRVRVVRDAIGPDITLMCDINQRWRPEQAIDIGSRGEDVGLFWLEDVTRADDYQGLARVTAGRASPALTGAVGESFRKGSSRIVWLPVDSSQQLCPSQRNVVAMR